MPLGVNGCKDRFLFRIIAQFTEKCAAQWSKQCAIHLQKRAWILGGFS